MAKLKTIILMFVMLSTTTFCYADLTAPNENGDGTPIEIKQSVGNIVKTKEVLLIPLLMVII